MTMLANKTEYLPATVFSYNSSTYDAPSTRPPSPASLANYLRYPTTSTSYQQAREVDIEQPTDTFDFRATYAARLMTMYVEVRQTQNRTAGNRRAELDRKEGPAQANKPAYAVGDQILH